MSDVRETPFGSLRTEFAKPKRKKKAPRKTAKQREAGRFLELYGIVHYLMTQQRCPVMFDGKLAYVRCPGVSKKAFKLAIDELVIRNCLAYVQAHTPNGKVIRHAGPKLP